MSIIMAETSDPKVQARSNLVEEEEEFSFRPQVRTLADKEEHASNTQLPLSGRRDVNVHGEDVSFWSDSLPQR